MQVDILIIQEAMVHLCTPVVTQLLHLNNCNIDIYGFTIRETVDYISPRPVAAVCCEGGSHSGSDMNINVGLSDKSN